MTDNPQLIEDCKNNKPEAYELLYKTYARTLMGIALRYASGNHEAEDILQEAFIRIFKHINTYQYKGSFEGWLKRVVVTTAINRFNQVKNRQENINTDTITNSCFDDNENALEKLSAQDLLKMINRLPPGYKMVFNLFAIEGYSHKEIAGQLKISEGTSKSQLSKARNMLQEMLAEYNVVKQ